MQMIGQFMRVSVLPVVVFVVTMAGGCATRLAPEYDQAILDGLNASNAAAMTLFAALSEGAKHSDFSRYESQYAGVIGAVQALEMQIAARPIPEVSSDITSELGAAGEAITTPAVEPVRGMSRTLETMRTVHSKTDLTKTEVTAFKNQWVIYADQALTYESHLER
jgi:hypothetical protein